MAASISQDKIELHDHGKKCEYVLPLPINLSIVSVFVFELWTDTIQNVSSIARQGRILYCFSFFPLGGAETRVRGLRLNK